MSNILSKPLILISWFLGGLVGVVLTPFVLGVRVAGAMADAVLRQAAPFRTLRPPSLRVDVQEEVETHRRNLLLLVREDVEAMANSTGVIRSQVDRLVELADQVATDVEQVPLDAVLEEAGAPPELEVLREIRDFLDTTSLVGTGTMIEHLAEIRDLLARAEADRLGTM